jgi:anti-sigma factor RsiW
MEKDKMEGMLIDYIDGNLSEAERKAVEQELAGNPEANTVYLQLREVLGTLNNSRELEPGKRLREKFEEALRIEIESAGKPMLRNYQLFFQPVLFRAAAAVVLVMVGIGIGFWINKNQQREADLAALRKEVEATKQMMMAMLDNQQSASQRMLGATVAFKMEKADDEIVKALTKAMNEDPNTNVRLAALEALGKFRHQAHVRAALIRSLTTQKDPVIQIALIRMMVEMKEKEAVKELRRITTDDEVLPAVKDEAHAGLLKLS